jgi:hypothetical protein
MKIPERSPDLRIYFILVAIIFLSVLTVGCTITHNFGPFMGKVVDAKTGEPIEGAVVLIGFYTKSGSVGGWVGKFADAIETLTDAKGEFHFSSKRIYLLRSNAIWDDRYQITIFKPGYGAYPGNLQAYSSWKKKQSYFIPENKYITYYLPKLNTLEERTKNHYKIITPAGITENKMQNLRKLIDEDNDARLRMKMERNK